MDTTARDYQQQTFVLGSSDGQIAIFFESLSASVTIETTDELEEGFGMRIDTPEENLDFPLSVTFDETQNELVLASKPKASSLTSVCENYGTVLASEGDLPDGVSITQNIGMNEGTVYGKVSGDFTLDDDALVVDGTGEPVMNSEELLNSLSITFLVPTTVQVLCTPPECVVS